MQQELKQIEWNWKLKWIAQGAQGRDYTCESWSKLLRSWLSDQRFGLNLYESGQSVEVYNIGNISNTSEKLLLTKLITLRQVAGDLQPQATYKWSPTRANHRMLILYRRFFGTSFWCSSILHLWVCLSSLSLPPRCLESDVSEKVNQLVKCGIKRETGSTFRSRSPGVWSQHARIIAPSCSQPMDRDWEKAKPPSFQSAQYEEQQLV